MSIWMLAALAVVALLFISPIMNRRTCAKGFAQGAASAGLPYSQVKEQFQDFLKPMRPMDAAAYRRGVEYMVENLETPKPWEAIKADFMRMYKSGQFTREGTEIRQMGAQRAAEWFHLRLSGDVKKVLDEDPSLSPVAAKAVSQRNIL